MAARIAVIDDDVATLESFAALLNLDGYTVETFNAGWDFLTAQEREPFDCVLLDIRMPRFDGWDVLRALMVRDPSPPVILMTGSPKLVSLETARQFGACSILEKPIEGPTLINEIVTALNMGLSSRAHRDNPL